MVHTLEKVCCLSLRTFGLVIGWLGAIGSISGVILTACALRYSNEIADYLLREAHTSITANTHADARSEVVLLGTIYLGSSLINGVVSSLLVFGILKNRYVSILPWLVINFIGLALNILYILFLFVVYAIYQGPIDIVIKFFAALLYFALYYYVFCGICSLYKQMYKSNRHQPLV
ncbi:uncharacterized protein LOC132791083 [Drosophila nasuta]|uniref:uncharacterized protein LOC132791083 n=1 Tax=Drosophila nasuta TaxID=42062 RepID=UPI00295E8792|nr:uncharacterized protein LOC132791083 [Drosophila nasuta]